MMITDFQLREDEITITLWGLQAHQFEDLKSEYQRSNVILIVTGTKAVMFKGNLPFKNYLAKILLTY